MTLWFVNRGTGVVLVALLTMATALGVLSTTRLSRPLWPRWATQRVHRNVSLLAVLVLLLHAGAAVADEFVDLRWYHVLVPIGGEYVAKERTALVLSALAFDAMVLVVVTSLLRDRLPLKMWRGVHLLAYLAWALGLLHGLLIGTDAKASWTIAVYVISLAVVLVAVAARLFTLRAEQRGGTAAVDDLVRWPAGSATRTTRTGRRR